MAELLLAVMILGLTAYAVLGGADFGAGFWDLTAGGAERGARLRGLVKRSMGPVWEANHVWLIFVLVIFWTCFPPAFAAVMQTLYVPLFLALVGIVLRGGAFALRGEAATIREARVLGATFALSSVLAPFFLGVTVGAVAAGQVPAGPPGDAIGSWTDPTALLAGAMAVITGAFLAAVFMAADAVRAGLPDLVAALRARALGSGIVAGALALGGLAVVRADAPSLYDGLTSGIGLACVLASGLAGLATLALVWRRRFGPARLSASVAVGSIIVGMVAAMSPDILPGELTLDAAAAGESTLIATLISVAIGLCVLIPSLLLLFRLTLRGELDPEFQPIGSRERAGRG